MLDTGKSIKRWHWAGAGKHPVATDFIQVGEAFPLFTALSQWMERGYQGLPGDEKALSMHTWRFWARGIKKGHVACGLLRDSCDRLGRPYPLLITGTGELEKWENHWEMLPLACEAAWTQMESFATTRFRDVDEMRNDLTSLRPPSNQWSHFGGNDFATHSSSPPRKLIEDLGADETILLPLELLASHEQKMQILAWHRLLKNHLREMPNVVFMGAIADNPYLFIGKRALVSGDFQRLWGRT